MCGIAGIIQKEPGYYDLQQLTAMTDALSHRGPDGVAHWKNPGGVALLGHRRLAIIDPEPRAAQPLHYLSRYSIVHNGEIYNYIELKEELAAKGYSFHTSSDTEVILAAYDCWQDACVEHFNGMFAFAIWDEKEQELFAARDRFGEKPFYYHINEHGFLFASEMKAFWRSGVHRDPNLRMLFNFLTIGYTDNPAQPSETFYNGILKLPPATLLYYSPHDHKLFTDRYWEIDPGQVRKKISDTAALEEFDQLFQQSVRWRLRSDVPIGSSLSGGLDSSTVLATASPMMTGQQVRHAFTASFPGFEKDESLFAKVVAEQLHWQHHLITPDADGLLADWEQLCQHQEEPFNSASTYIQYKVYQAARNAGVKVLLDGQGADETIAGYHKYYKWYWQELFVKRKLVRSGEIRAARSLGIQEPFGLKNVVAALFPDLASVILERRYLLKAIQTKTLTRSFVKNYSQEAYYTTPDYFNLNGALHFNTFTHGLEELLRLADRNSMAHGREVRLPFLDHQLVSFLFSLPANLKIREGWTKWILRNYAQPMLPDAIVWRKDKIGYEPPQAAWLQHPGIREAIAKARKKLVEHGILESHVLQEPIISKNSHDADNYDWRYLAGAAFL